MTIPVTLPQMGESVVEGTVERWLVREGARVEKDQIVCEVTTDKVDAEIPAPEAGVLAKILVPEGTTVDGGTELAVIDPEGVATASPAPAAEPASASASASAAAAPPESDPRISPLARRIAEDKGVPLDEMRGTGPSGRVTKDDVLGYLARGTATPAPSSATPVAVRPGTLLEKLAPLRVPPSQAREGFFVASRA